MNAPPRVGVVLVHFHTPELARDAVAAYRRCAETEGLAVDIVLVDNGSTPAERDVLDALDARRIDPGGNTGYAGGVNRGVRALGEADVHVLANPDVLVEPGCLTALVDAIRDGAAVAGPRFFWDRPGSWMLPPTEAVGWWDDLGRLLAATRAGAWTERARRRWWRHARGHWTAVHPVTSFDLSGALLAVDGSAWRTVGPFDEGYRLYFEETDWLQRVRRAGLDARHVPGAHAVHLYAQSTPSEPRAQAWFAESQARFRRRNHGRVGSGLLALVARHLGSGRTPVAPGTEPEPRDARWPADPKVRWIEMSPSPLGFPAAGLRLDAGTRGDEPFVPEAIWERLAPGRYWLRALDAEDRERAVHRVERSP